MRTAYSGRAAAYLAIRRFDEAIADENLVILYYALEVEIGGEQDTPDRDKFLREAAAAYRTRADMLIKAERFSQAEADLKHAEKLDGDAQRLVERKKKAKAAAIPPDAPH
jgi:hypothetical protein